MPSMSFTLVGHDRLSRVLDRAGDASNRLGRRLLATSINSDAAVRRFANNASRNLSQLEKDSDAGEKALGELGKAALLLAPAAIPAAASLAPIAAGAGTVAVALAAMGAALGPQIKAMGDAATAQGKYGAAVAKYGANSKQAIEAQIAYSQAMSALPPKTREAAAAVGVLQENYKHWSDSLAGDTMAPFIKGVSIANALLPKTSGLVKAASTETDRFMTILGGEIASPGLDRLNAKFTAFTEKTLRGLNNELLHLLRTTDGAKIGGGLHEFMDYARAQGPVVGDVLRSVGTALVNVLKAGSDVGVGLLQVVQVLAHLVSAVPPSAIGIFLQLAVALKVTKAAAFGMAAARTALASFGTQLVAMQTAAAAAPGRLRALGAAIGAMSRTAKAAMVGTGIGLLIVALGELSQRGKETPPDVDKLTTSLGELARTGKVAGEAARAFGTDLGGLADSLRTLSRPSNLDKTQQFLTSLIGMDSTPVKEAKENLDAVDKSLAGLVQSGKSELAEAAFNKVAAAMRKQGMSSGELRGKLDDYKAALADQRFEAELAAQSQGLFGAQAQAVQQKLDAQKASADGLRQSLQALNDVNRQGLGGMIGFEAALDAAAKAARANHGALSMTNGVLNLGSEKARNAAGALNDLAQKTDEAAASARQSGSSWETVNGIYARGRETFIKSARAMGLNKQQAAALADQIMKIPDKTARVKMEKEDAQRDLEAFNSAVKASPGSKSVTLHTLSKAAESILNAFGFKVTHLKDGSVKITASAGGALGVIGSVAGAIASLHDRHITLTTEHRTIYTGKGGRGPNAYAGGGTPKAGELAIVGEEGPELVVFGEAARVYDASKTKAILSGKGGTRAGAGPGLQGMNGAGAAAAQGLAAGMTGSLGVVESAARRVASAVTAGIREELQIASPSKKTKALAKDVGAGFIQGLTGTRAKIKSTSADLVKDIKTAFSGRKETGLVKAVDKNTKRLLDLAAKRDKLAAKIAAAKAFASDVTKTARDQSSLSSLGLEPAQVTAGSIKGGLAAKLGQVKQFTKYIEILAKRGLNRGVLRQILNMGPEAGYAYASALVGASKDTIKQINSLDNQIGKATDSLGKLGADRLYDSGKNAGKGFLKGLEGQEKDIEKLMLKIAKSMQKALRHALGIKSPSTVMAKLGAYSTQGLARGLVGALPEVDRAMAVVSARVSNTRPAAGRPAVVTRGWAESPINITVQGAIDPYATARELEKVLAKYRRGRGGASYSFA